MKKRTRIKWKNVIKATALVVTVGVGVSCVWANKDTPEPTDLNPKMIAEAHIQEEGFKEYKIPVEFAAEGGKMDVRTQKRTWYACHGYNISYPLVLAIIEAESGYHAEARNNHAGAIGYMQIVPDWHQERISRMHADIENYPVDNILVGIDYLAELQEHCIDENYLLMSYNMGLSEATRLWQMGIHSTEYSRYILNRKKEITRELEGAYL